MSIWKSGFRWEMMARLEGTERPITVHKSWMLCMGHKFEFSET